MSDMNESEAQSRHHTGESGEGESAALDCLEHFAFKQAPFADQPDPAVPFVPAGGQDPAVALEAALVAPLEPGAEPPGRVIMLRGPQGIGKSLTCRTLAQRLGQDRAVALLDGLTHGSPMTLPAALCAGFGLPPSDTLDETIRTLWIFLEDRLARGRRGLVILDNAQALGLAGLESLAQMLALECRGAPLLQAVLAGPDSLDPILERPALRSLAQCVTDTVQIRPFSVKQARGYIDHRIAQARSEGVTFDPITDEAKTRIARAAGGVPGAINALCTGALDFTARDGLPRVTAAEAEEVVAVLLPKAVAPQLYVPDEDVKGKTKPARSGRRGFGLVAATVLGLAAVGGGAVLLLKDTDALQRAQGLVAQVVDSVSGIANAPAPDLQDAASQDAIPLGATETETAPAIPAFQSSVAPPPTGGEASPETTPEMTPEAADAVDVAEAPVEVGSAATSTAAGGASLVPPDRPDPPPIESGDNRVADALSRLDALREHMRQEGQVAEPVALPPVDATEGADRAQRISELLAERAALLDRPRGSDTLSTLEQALSPPVGQQADSGISAPDYGERIDSEIGDGGIGDGAPAGPPPTDVSQADVSQADVSQADVSQADVSQADVSQADVSQTASPQPSSMRSDPAMDSLAAVLLAARGASGTMGGEPVMAPSVPPVPAPPVSAPPVSAPPVSAPPVSAPPVSAPPVSAPPVSAPSRPTEDPGQPLWQRAGRLAPASAPDTAPASAPDTGAGTTLVRPAPASPTSVAGLPRAPVAPVSAFTRSPSVEQAPSARLDGEASLSPSVATGAPPNASTETRPAAPVDWSRTARAWRQAEEDRRATAALNTLSLQAARTGRPASMIGRATGRVTAPRAVPFGYPSVQQAPTTPK